LSGYFFFGGIMEKVECEECGKIRDKSQGIEIWGAYFCSEKCKEETDLRISKGRKCLGCGKFYTFIGLEFLVDGKYTLDPSLWNKIDYDEWHFCSQECQQKAVRDSQKVVRKTECENCGKLYCNIANEGDYDCWHFCSLGCEQAHDKKWKESGV
jgi:YHS domain-containing protein